MVTYPIRACPGSFASTGPFVHDCPGPAKDTAGGCPRIAARCTPRWSGRGNGGGDATVRVAIVSSEAAPFAKTGGLADMVGSLAAALRAARARRDPRPAGVPPRPRTWRTSPRPAWPSRCRPPAASSAPDVLKGDAGEGRGRLVRAGRSLLRPRRIVRPGEGVDYADNADRFAWFARAAPRAAGPARAVRRAARPRLAGGSRRRVPPAATRRATRRWPRRGRCSPCTTSVIRDGSTRPSSRVSRWTRRTSGRTSSSTATSVS